MGLLDILGGIGTAGAGGIVETIGWGLGDLLGVDDIIGDITGAGSAGSAAFGDIFKQVTSEVPKMMGELNWNPMGQTGNAARLGAKSALGGDWQAGSATGYQAFRDTMSDASRLRDAGNLAARGAVQQATSQTGKLSRDLMNLARSSGAPAAALSRVGASAGEGMTNSLTDTFNKSISTNMAAAQSAAGLTQQAAQGRMQDIANTYQQKVVPYLNNMQDIGSVLGAASGPAASLAGTQATLAEQARMKSNPLAGAGGLMGLLGSDWSSKGLYDMYYGAGKDKTTSTPDTSGLLFQQLLGTMNNGNMMPFMFGQVPESYR